MAVAFFELPLHHIVFRLADFLNYKKLLFVNHLLQKSLKFIEMSFCAVFDRKVVNYMTFLIAYMSQLYIFVF